MKAVFNCVLPLVLVACGGGGYAVSSDQSVIDAINATKCPMGTYYYSHTCYAFPTPGSAPSM